MNACDGNHAWGKCDRDNCDFTTPPAGRRRPVSGGALSSSEPPNFSPGRAGNLAGHPSHRLLRFDVLGIPQPQGSKDAHHHDGKTWVTESNKQVRPWRMSVIDAAYKAYGVDLQTITGPVSLTVRFRFPRPKHHFGTGRNAGILKASAPSQVTSKIHGDLDKLIRAVADALTEAGVWRDDSQVVVVFAVKDYDRRPGALIEVVEL